MVEKIMFWVKYPRSLQKHREGCIRKNIKSLILQIVESVDVVLFFLFTEKHYLRTKEIVINAKRKR